VLCPWGRSLLFKSFLVSTHLSLRKHQQEKGILKLYMMHIQNLYNVPIVPFTPYQMEGAVVKESHICMCEKKDVAPPGADHERGANRKKQSNNYISLIFIHVRLYQ